MGSDQFDRAGKVPEDWLHPAAAFVFASPAPVTTRMLAPLLPKGQNAHVVLAALQARCVRRGVILAEAAEMYQIAVRTGTRDGWVTSGRP